MSEIESPNGDLVTFTYAPVNRKSDELRLSKEAGLEFTSYLWDDQNIALELDDVGTVEAEYTVVPQAYGNLVSQTRSTDSSFYHFDPLGSTRELTDETETVTDDYRYSVFGEVKNSTGTTINLYQWVGKEGYYRDAESGLYSLRNRFYGAGEGRFKSEDPIGLDAGDSNLYRYVGNNAATDTDPSGLDFQAKIEETNDWVSIANAKNSALNGYVGNKITSKCTWRKEDNRGVMVVRSVGSGSNNYFCATFSKIVLAVRKGKVTSNAQWNHWFISNGYPCDPAYGYYKARPGFSYGSFRADQNERCLRPDQISEKRPKGFTKKTLDVPNLSSGCFPTALDQNRTCQEAFYVDFPNATQEFATYVAKELAIQAATACAGGFAIKFSLVICGPVVKVTARVLGKVKELTFDKLMALYRKLRLRKGHAQSQELADQIERELKNINQFDENISLDPSGRSNCVSPRGKLEGKTEYKVRDPDTDNLITDIDEIEDGVLWERKTAWWAGDIERWVEKHIKEKFNDYLKARKHLPPNYQNAPIGFKFDRRPEPALAEAIEEAIEELRRLHPDIDIFLEW